MTPDPEVLYALAPAADVPDDAWKTRLAWTGAQAPTSGCLTALYLGSCCLLIAVGLMMLYEQLLGTEIHFLHHPFSSHPHVHAHGVQAGPGDDAGGARRSI